MGQLGILRYYKKINVKAEKHWLEQTCGIKNFFVKNMAANTTTIAMSNNTIQQSLHFGFAHKSRSSCIRSRFCRGRDTLARLLIELLGGIRPAGNGAAPGFPDMVKCGGHFFS